MLEQVFNSLLERGLPGIAIIILLYAVWKLYGKYDEVQEKRIAESRDAIKAIEQSTSTLETLTEVLRDRGK